MGRDIQAEVTGLLKKWRGGEPGAFEQLISAVLPELKRAARGTLRSRAGETLRPTVLVNELYLRLVRAADIEWKDRAHFFAVIGQMMRRIVVDYARAQGARKRSGEGNITFDEQFIAGSMRPLDLIAVDDALTALGKLDRRKSQVVELRYFIGLTVEETAEVLGISPETVLRDWRFARSWLSREIRGSERRTPASGSLPRA